MPSTPRCAIGFALQVVEPHLNGPGGDVPILLYSAKNDRVDVICGQGVAPAAATIEAYRQPRISISCPAPGCSRPSCPAPSTPGC